MPSVNEQLIPESDSFLEYGNRPFYKVDSFVSSNPILDEFVESYARHFKSDLSDQTVVSRIVNEFYMRIEYGLLDRIVFSGREYKLIPGHFLQKNNFEALASHKKTAVLSPPVYGPVARAEKKPVIYIMAESPAFQEAQDGMHFTGPFGRILWKALYENFPDILDHFDIYCSNVCRVPLDKSKEPFFAWIRLFRPVIVNELFAIKPTYVVPIGVNALKFFTRSSQQTVKTYGERYEYSVPNGNCFESYEAELFALPLDALQGHDNYNYFNSRVRYFVKYLLKGNPLPQDNITFKLLDTVDVLKAEVDGWLGSGTLKRIAIDSEWEGYYPTNSSSFIRCISLATDESAYIVPVCDTEGNFVFGGTKEDIANQLNRIFDPKANTQIIGHNFIADAIWLEHLGINVVQKWKIPESTETPDYAGVFDTIIAHHAVDECATFDLEKSAELYVDAIPWSKEVEEFKKGKKITGYGFIPDHILFPYAARDAYYTLKLFYYHSKALDSDMYGNKSWTPYWINMMACLGFLEARRTGIAVDVSRLQVISDMFQEMLNVLNKKLTDMVGWPEFNPRSSQQCVALFFGEKYLKKSVLPEGVKSLNLKPVKTTRGAPWDEEAERLGISPSMDAEVCEFYAQTVPAVRLLRDIRLLDQALKTVLPGSNVDSGISKFICEDGRIHPHYYPLKETRRCSCKEPNIQNLSKSREEDYKRIFGDAYIAPIRTIFVADSSEHALVEIDYSAAELLMLGVAAQDENLISDYYRSNLPDDDPNKLDIHSNIAVLAFNLDCEPTKNALKELGLQNYRLYAKRIIFGLNYGRSAKSCYNQLVSQGADVTLEQVERIIHTIYSRYNNIPRFQTAVKKRVIDPGWIRNCFGSYRRFFIFPNNTESLAAAEREALNFPCQSGVADAISIAMANFYCHPSKKEVGYRLCMNNHDALVFSVPKKNLDIFTGQIVKECMVDGVPLRECDLDGRHVSSKVYHFNYEVEVFSRWNEKD